MAVSEASFETLKSDFETMRTEAAVRAERDKSIEARLAKIESILARLTWLIVAGIGVAFVSWVVSGGLAPPAKAAVFLVPPKLEYVEG